MFLDEREGDRERVYLRESVYEREREREREREKEREREREREHSEVVRVEERKKEIRF